MRKALLARKGKRNEVSSPIQAERKNGAGKGTHLEGAVLASGLEAEDTESLGNDHLLLLVVRRGHTLEELQALKGGRTTGGLGRANSVSSLVPSPRTTPPRDGRTLWGTIPRMVR